jgi:diguanylate cyclase
VARYGGEEFFLVLPDTDLAGAEAVVNGLRDRLRMESDEPLAVTFSAGVTQWKSGESFEHLASRADGALYEAKRSGRDRVVMA